MTRDELMKEACTRCLDAATAQPQMRKEAALPPQIANWLSKLRRPPGASAVRQSLDATEKVSPLSHLGSVFGMSHKPGTVGERMFGALGLKNLGGRRLAGASSKERAILEPALRRQEFRRRMAVDTGGFGLFGGALGAATSDEGDRLSGFAKGLGMGALGGAGWGYGSALGKKSLQALAKRRLTARRLADKPASNFWSTLQTKTRPTRFHDGKLVEPKVMNVGSAARGKGAVPRALAGTLAGVGTFGGGMAGSIGAEHAATSAFPALEGTPHVSTVAGAASAAHSASPWLSARHVLGVTPETNAGALYRAASTTPGNMF